MVDTSRSGQRGGRQGQEYQPESTGASDTNPTTNTNVSGENPRPIMTFAALSDRINEELAHTSPGSVPQSTSDVNATAERGANTNFLSPADLATRLNQHIERFGVFNSPFGAPRTLSDGLVRRLALQVDQLINSNDAIKKKLEGFGERLQRLEARSTAVEERLQAFDEQLQRFAGSSHEVERRLNNLDYIDQLTNNHLEQVEGALPPLDERVRRLETRSMANQNDAVTRLANRLSRTNQRLDQLEERIPEDDEHWARVLEVTREAANPTSAPPYEIDQLELPPYGPVIYRPNLHGPHPHGIHSQVGLRSLGTQRRIPVLENALVANAQVVHDGHSTTREATNGEATNGEATNGEATNGEATNGRLTNGEATNGRLTNGQPTNGVATNGSANRQMIVTIRRLERRPILQDHPQHSHLDDEVE